jgi:hypothetical protein
MSREHARPQPPAGSRRYGGGAEEPAPGVPVGVTGHRTQRPRGQVGPPGPHPAQPSSSLDPGGERRAPISPHLAPLIAQLVGWSLVAKWLGLGLGLGPRPRWAGSGSEPWGPRPTPWPTAAPGGAGREGGALCSAPTLRWPLALPLRAARCALRAARCRGLRVLRPPARRRRRRSPLAAAEARAPHSAFPDWRSCQLPAGR